MLIYKRRLKITYKNIEGGGLKALERLMVIRMKNLVKEYLKRRFFKEKNMVIGHHIVTTDNGANIYPFTNEQHQVVILNGRAYSRNGYFFSVILKDDKYIEEVKKNEKEAIIEFFDKEFAPAYEANNVEPEPDEE